MESEVKTGVETGVDVAYEGRQRAGQSAAVVGWPIARALASLALFVGWLPLVCAADPASARAAELQALKRDYLAYRERVVALEQQAATTGSYMAAQRAIYTDARELFERAQPLFDPASRNAVNLHKNFALRALNANDIDGALRIHRRWLRAMRAAHGSDCACLFHPWFGLGEAYARNGQLERSLVHFERALRSLALPDAGAASTAPTRHEAQLKVARILLASGFAPQAERFLRDIVDTPSQQGRYHHLARYHLAESAEQQGDLQRATTYFEQLIQRQTGAAVPGELQLKARAQLVALYERQGLPEQATVHCLAIGRMLAAGAATLGDAQLGDAPAQPEPLYAVAPSYPYAAIESSRSGWVVLEFAINPAGFVEQPVVIDSQGGFSFERSALAAIGEFRFAPQFVDGEPVASRAQYKIDFARWADRARSIGQRVPAARTGDPLLALEG